MNKTIFKLLALVILVTFSSCDNSKKMDYKYSESPKLLACDYPNGALLKEAVYAFENDITNTYDSQNKSVSKAYSSFISNRLRGSINVKDIASAHSLSIAKALKEDSDLWVLTNGKTSLNTSHPLIDCIANNIKDKDIKATFNALLATNSLKPKLILPLLSTSARVIQADGNLKSYIAFEFFYSQLLDVNLEDLKNPEAQAEPATPSVNDVNLNKMSSEKAPVKSSTRPGHEGHNHD